MLLAENKDLRDENSNLKNNISAVATDLMNYKKLDHGMMLPYYINVTIPKQCTLQNVKMPLCRLYSTSIILARTSLGIVS